MSNTYLNTIKALITQKTGTEPTEVLETSYFEDDLNIGELELTEVLTELEETYKVDLVDSQDEIETVQDLVDLLVEKLE